MNPSVLTETASTTIDVIGALKPLMASSMTQIVDMITSLVPYMITVSLFGAGIYLLKRFISTGTQSL